MWLFFRKFRFFNFIYSIEFSMNLFKNYFREYKVKWKAEILISAEYTHTSMTVHCLDNIKKRNSSRFLSITAFIVVSSCERKFKERFFTLIFQFAPSLKLCDGYFLSPLLLTINFLNQFLVSLWELLLLLAFWNKKLFHSLKHNKNYLNTFNGVSQSKIIRCFHFFLTPTSVLGITFSHSTLIFHFVLDIFVLEN